MRNLFLSLKYFYRECTVFNLIFTAIGIELWVVMGPFGTPYIFWLKILGYLFTGIIYYWYKKDQFYFYHNLSVSKRTLILISLVIDVIVTFTLLFLINAIVK